MVNSLISITVDTSNAVCPKRTPAACDLILAIGDYKDFFFLRQLGNMPLEMDDSRARVY